MKNFKYILLFIIPLVLFSCSKDFLDRPPEDAIVVDNFYNTSDELRMSTGALYSLPWFSFNDKANFVIGDGAAGIYSTGDGALNQFYQFSITGTNNRLNEAWFSLYRVIGYANSFIKSATEKAGESVTQEELNAAIAEARFMRAVAYSYLVICWGPVPIIEDATEHIQNPEVPRHRTEDVWQFAINDMTFAAENLYDVDQPGRVTSWSAKGMLARFYLYRAGLNGSKNQADIDMARTLSEDVVKNSGLTLMEDYADLFKIENDNNPESLFALQWVMFADQWGNQNTHQAYFAPEGKLTGVGDGWGGGSGAAPNMQEMYEPGDERRKATFMYYGDYYPELLQSEGGYTYEKQSDRGSAIKKYVVGTPDDNNGEVAFMRTPLNTYMMRLSEVYLIYAESLMGTGNSTNDADALMYYNMVRDRAGLGDDADGTLTWMEIFNEKRIELAMEGHNWYDIVRWSYFDESGAVAYLNAQDRGTYTWTDDVKEVNSVYYPVSAEQLKFPYPESELVNNPAMLGDPVPYDFTN